METPGLVNKSFAQFCKITWSKHYIIIKLMQCLYKDREAYGGSLTHNWAAISVNQLPINL